MFLKTFRGKTFLHFVRESRDSQDRKNGVFLEKKNFKQRKCTSFVSIFGMEGHQLFQIYEIITFDILKINSQAGYLSLSNDNPAWFKV